MVKVSRVCGLCRPPTVTYIGQDHGRDGVATRRDYRVRSNIRRLNVILTSPLLGGTQSGACGEAAHIVGRAGLLWLSHANRGHREHQPVSRWEKAAKV